MPAKLGVAVGATAAAVVAPMLMGHWLPLGHGMLAQMLSVALWGLAAAAWASLPGPAAVPWRGLRPLLLAFGLLACGIAASALAHPTPPGVWLGSLGVVAAAALVAIAGARAARQRPEGAEWATRALMWGLAIAAIASLIVATLQLAAPGSAPALLVAAVRTPGRASGNMDQPNHLAILLLWAWLAVAAWPARAAEAAPGPPLPLPGASAAATFATPAGTSFALAFALQAGLVATASRAGLLASMVIGLWAALDRRLPRPTAWLLWITALVGVAMALGRAVATPAASLGAGASLVRPGARGGVFMDAVALISESPLTGVGWMEFQLAWSLAPLGDRGPRYFDHAHNLVMNLIAELGVPLGLAICAALIWGAFALLRALQAVSPAMQPRALMLAAMLALVGVASLFDSPFWHAYLLLPSAWAWGCLVGLENEDRSAAGEAVVPPAAQGARHEHSTPTSRGTRVGAALFVGGLALACATLFAWLDFRRALPGEPGSAGAGSKLFSYYADQRHALAAGDARPEIFRSARWVWIDTHLLAAWIAALERSGRIDEARYLMQRALEFRDPAFTPWLAACRVVEPLEPPSRCRAPERTPRWQDFR